ncbi:glycoside hydrolase family 76 protein [Streptomyces sp. DW26H14]|uniref:glycoside hydrolase family 76 protein n=1 Tax=Streptomyces sp. DW26H14 TaxID=3435395 RepID=UPI00403DE0BC
MHPTSVRAAITRGRHLALLGALALALCLFTALAASPQRADALPASAQANVQAAASVKPAAASICDIYCDARDPSNATSQRDAATATVNGRKITLVLSDNDVMGFATIGDGGQGDEVWLDRSFDGGRTWASGSKLGDTKTPAGSAGWRTQMYNVDDWVNAGVGALRACGEAAGQSGIACTGWARVDRNASTPSKAAATALMMLYDNKTGLFESNGWWTGANALTAIIDNSRISGMGSYKYAISTTYDLNKNAQGGNFTNNFMDDTGWWGMAWVDAYDATGDSRYLDTARADADHMNAYWETGTCGGGVWWSSDSDKHYKNSITNELYLELNAALHNRISGDTTYLGRANAEWSWLKGSGLLDRSDHLIQDGLDSSTCKPTGQTYTYNQGVILGGLSELHQATNDSGLLDEAKTLANASTTSSTLNPSGVLSDIGEANSCSSDGAAFKGPYVRGLAALNSALSDHPYSAYLDHQADVAHANDRNGLDQYGPHWNGPFSLPTPGHNCQQVALSLLNAAEEN